MKPALAGIFVAAVCSGASLVDEVDKRVHAVQPTREERRLDEIGWARDVRDAEALAKQHGRPVFLFTYDGNIATGRC